MIFNKEYDSSLWLMMNGNEKVKKELISFFNKFPQELLIMIRESLKKYNAYSQNRNFVANWDLYRDDLTGSISNESGLTYTYCINALGCIELGESLVSEKEFIPLNYLAIYPFKKDVYDNLDRNASINLGTVAEGYSFIDNLFYIPCNLMTEFYLEKGIFNTCFVNISGFLTKGRKQFSIISVDKIPDNYSLMDLEEKNKKTRGILIKKRTK